MEIDEDEKIRIRIKKKRNKRLSKVVLKYFGVILGGLLAFFAIAIFFAAVFHIEIPAYLFLVFITIAIILADRPGPVKDFALHIFGIKEQPKELLARDIRRVQEVRRLNPRMITRIINGMATLIIIYLFVRFFASGAINNLISVWKLVMP